MYKSIKQHLVRTIALCLLLPFFFSLLAISGAGAYSLVEALDSGTKSTVSSKTNYSLMTGVTESTVALTGGDKGYMLQIAPTAKANLKVSYSKYFTSGSSKASRSAAASKLSYTFTRPTVQAAAYEAATSRNVIYAMNANFADINTCEPFGLIKVEGNTIHPSDGNAICYFAILEDGSYDFRSYTDDHSDVVEAVAGRHWLVRDGKQVRQNNEKISARSAIGLKADGTVVTFIVNGKTDSIGVTINDMSELMFSLGCVDAINLDGGGSSLFATQRPGNSGLVIRNTPPDPNGERAVSSSLLLVTEPETDRLYFDFTNDAEAQNRYSKDIYKGRNYDTGNWHYTHTYSTAPVFDNTAGTMSFSTTADFPSTRHIHPLITSSNTSYTGGHPLAYVPTGNDYFKLRMKIEGSTDTDANFRLMYATDDSDESTFVAYSAPIPAGCINNGYFTLEGNLSFAEVDAITAIRPEVYNLLIADPAKTKVKFTYDYIYVGPKSASATEDYLLFDFDNSRQARERYDTLPYGFLNFDRSSKGYWATAYNSSASAFTIDNSQGLLNVEVTDGFSGTAEAGNLTYGPWIKTTNSYGKFTGRATYSYFPFSFSPKNSDILQIRFKTENCRTPTGKTPTVVLEYYYTLNDAHSYKNDIRQGFTMSNGEFQTLSIPVSETFRGADRIKCFGLRFQNVKGDPTGSIGIDYIYMGPSCKAPDSMHNWDNGKVTVEPTCNVAGVKTFTCSTCKDTKTEVIPAKGHTEVVDKAVAATCTTAGKTEGKHCSDCNAVLVAQQTVPAMGHTEVIDKAVAATCTTAGKTEGKHCSVCSAVLVAQQTIPATGHSYIYTKIDALTHKVTCKNCSYSTETAHSYKDGFCSCGEPEVKEPIEEASLKLNHSLNLASDISVNLLVSKTLLEGFDMSTVYVESIVDCYEGNHLTGTSTLRIEPVENGNYYYFTLNGLTAVQMNDRISSVLYGTKDGQPYCSTVDEYSIAAYAYSQLNNPDRPEALKTLCADLLRYGAKAQIFKSYRTDALADADMTAAHRAYLSDIEAVTFGNTNKVLNDVDNAPISWAGKALDLESKVALKFVFDPVNYKGDLSKLSLKVSYTDIHGTVKTVTLEAPELYNPDRKLYAFTVDALLAAELRTVVSVQIFAGSTPVSCTLQYSADTYGNNKEGTLLDLCKALFAYSDSARAYFS